MPRLVLRRIPALDGEPFGRVARMHTPELDYPHAQPRRQQLEAVARRRGTAGGLRRPPRQARRAARAGSIAATSLLVNRGVKRVVRRPRPALRHVPGVRRPVQPLTTSFPSGHAASAGAFTAVWRCRAAAGRARDRSVSGSGGLLARLRRRALPRRCGRRSCDRSRSARRSGHGASGPRSRPAPSASSPAASGIGCSRTAMARTSPSSSTRTQDQSGCEPRSKKSRAGCRRRGS